MADKKPRSPRKKTRNPTTARALYISHRSCFGPMPMCEVLTEKQIAILNGTAKDPRRTDVSRLINKLEYFERYEDVEMVYDMYGYLFHEVYEDDPSPDDALSILDSLTPDDLK